MSDELLQKALQEFESQALRRQPPSLALLGPPGSGKSIFLNDLIKWFNQGNDALGDTRCLAVDLRTVRVGSQPEIYSHLNRTLLQEAARVGIDKAFDIKVQIPHLRFEEILRALLAAVEGRLIIFIDHLESVPRMFAGELSHRFRNFLETTEHDSEYLRLGLVIAGVVSLYDLKPGPNSAFQMLPVIRFPGTDSSTRVQLVEDYLKNYMSIEISRELLDLLAELTGGEPGFLDPLIKYLLSDGKHVSLSEELIAEGVHYLCSESRIDALRNLALHLWGDSDLREIVRDLGRHVSVMQRSVAPDIDRYELSGAVVVPQEEYSKTREYKFSNGIAKQYLTDLYNVIETNCVTPRTDLLIEKDLRQLEAAKSQCLNATQIWPWLNAVREAWVAITPFKRQPKLQLYLTKAKSNSGWWFDADLAEIPDPEVRGLANNATKAATFTALDQLELAFSGDTDSIKSFIESDPDQISIAIPLYAREIVVVIVATLSRVDAGRGLTEFDLCHWLRFVQNVKQVVPVLMLADMGHQTLHDQIRETQRRPKSVDGVKKKTVFLLPDGDGIVEEPGYVKYISGKVPNIEDMNKRCLDLVDKWTDHKKFEEGVMGIASQLETALEAKFRELREAIVPAPVIQQTVVASDKDGLKIPFELFPHANSHLALLTAISRQITGHPLRPDVCLPFDNLLTSLATSRQNLRVLLIASFKDGELGASEELKRVRQHITLGCQRMNLRVEFVELQPDEATEKKVDELMEQGPYHIVHYSGHGRHFSEDADASGVVLLDNDGGNKVIQCKKLRGWFTAAEPWLVYLSCCNSSASSGTGHGLSGRYLGMMDAVVLAGVPNVIGFRCLVSDQSALNLADEFYRQLFTLQAEKNLNLAMLAARRRVHNGSDFIDAWASSMLITQYS